MTIRGRWLLMLGAALLAATLPVGGQTLSEQVLRLLVRDNYWSGTQTFARTVGVTLESSGVPPVSTANTLYNLGGNLYFNGVVVATSAGAGTVTSVGLTLPAIFSVSGSPVTSSGTLSATLATQAANLVWAGPTTGADAAPTFRALVAADLPPISSGSITGIVPVANGGTGLASGTSGGVLGYTAAGTIASSAALAANQIVLGGGAGATPATLGALGTTTTVLHGNASGAPSWGAIVLTTDVTGVLPVANGGTGLASGTSGGVLYYSAAGTIASSAALTADRLVLGGGAGAAPTVLGAGTTTTVLHGNAAGAPTYGAVVLTTDVSGVLPFANGGTGLGSLAQGDLLYASATDTLSALAKNTTATRYLANTGTSNNPAWAQITLTNGVTGILPVANGGTGISSVPSNGQIPIGNGTTYTAATLTGTASQITVTNGAGTITLALPQSIDTTDTPRWARIGLGTGAGATAVLTTTGQFNLGLNAVGNCGAAASIDWNSGMQQTTTLNGASCTLTFNNPISGAPAYTLVLAQDGTGGRLVVWPGTILWAGGGAAPTLSTDPNAVDICRFLWNGTAYYGDCTLDYQ